MHIIGFGFGTRGCPRGHSAFNRLQTPSHTFRYLINDPRWIIRSNPDRDFDFWLNQYNSFLPSAQIRWCTRQLKLRPFERWLRPLLDQGKTVYSYVAIRGDEQYREGYSSKNENLIVKLPFKDAGIDKAGVMDILDASGLGFPFVSHAASHAP